jgi:predicted RND superfamily exporter protein
VLTAIAAPGLLRLELRTDGRALVPASAPQVIYDREVRDTFGVRDPIAVVLRSDHEDGIFRTETLRRVAELTTAFEGLLGVHSFDVVSLATELSFRHRPGTIRFRRLLEPVPESAEQLAELRDDLRRIELYNGTLVSADGSATAILVATPPERDRRQLIREIRGLIAASPAAAGERVEVLGAPVAESLLGSHILADLGVPPSLLGDAVRRGGMVPIAVTLMAVVFLVAFRRPAAALLPLTEIGVCLAIVFGVMGWLGVPVYLTISVLPVILTAVGAADEIHVFRRYTELSPDPSAGADANRELVRKTLQEMAPPIVKTSVTTAVAFLSFTLSPIPAVRAFGLCTAFGVLLCMVYSLTVIPALLVLGGARPWVGRHGWRPATQIGRLATAVAGLAFRHRVVVLLVAGVAALLAVDGVRRITVQDSWIDGFAATSDFARATRWFDDQFLGAHLLHLALEVDAPSLAGEVEESDLDTFELTLAAPAGLEPARLVDAWIRVRALVADGREWRTWCESARREESKLVLTMPRRRGSARFFLRPQAGDRLGYEIRSEPFTSPAVMQRVAALEAFVAALPGVGGVLGPARYLETVGFMVRPNDPQSRRLPGDPQTARNRWSNYGRMRGEERLAQLVDAGRRRALVTLFLEDSNYVDTSRLMSEMRDFERQHLLPHGIRLGFAGDVAVSQATIDAIVTTQVRSLLLSLAGILVVAAILSRSLWRGFYCLIPPAFAVLLCFAAMGWLAIPLGVATSMFAGMTLGVGVDFAIHLLARHDRARQAGLQGEAAVAAALTTTGPAIVIDACAVALGFGVLVFSQVPANARLGGLLVVSVLACLLTTLLAVPALLACRSSTHADND